MTSNSKQFGDAVRDATRLMRDWVANPERYPEDCVIMPLESFSGKRGALTRQRIRVFLAIRDDGPFESLEALARAIGRPMARVSQDVRALEAVELVRSVRNGRNKRLVANKKRILIT